MEKPHWLFDEGTTGMLTSRLLKDIVTVALYCVQTLLHLFIKTPHVCMAPFVY